MPAGGWVLAHLGTNKGLAKTKIETEECKNARLKINTF
jgi:hypothetical protein